MVAAVTGVLLMSGAWAIGPYFFEDRDIPTAIDSTEVREAAGPACRRMQERVEAAGSDEEENEAVEAMVAEIRQLGPETLAGDEPAELWLADWEAFVAARRAGDPIPEGGGAPIHLRMDELVKDLRACQIPEQMLPGRD